MRRVHNFGFAFWYEVKQHSDSTMKLQRPKGYPSATMPEALELPRHIPHWSWDDKGQRRVNKARWHVRRAAQRLMRRLVLEQI
jgi:hypothetical protein